jgi:hypothetical protein
MQAVIQQRFPATTPAVSVPCWASLNRCPVRSASSTQSTARRGIPGVQPATAFPKSSRKPRPWLVDIRSTVRLEWPRADGVRYRNPIAVSAPRLEVNYLLSCWLPEGILSKGTSTPGSRQDGELYVLG